MIRQAAVGMVAIVLVAACQPAPPPDRSGKLLMMASEEAALIPNKLDRLTRQLNIANTQLSWNKSEDADKSLKLAKDTLDVSKKEDMDDFHRIAAWTSVSQLARRAKDKDLAASAADKALAALNDVQPAAQRPQYVLSLASELAELRGKDAAVELVVSGGGWAGEIVEPNARREALTAFADRLVWLEAYESARTVLQHDPEAAWRADVFLTMANTPSGYFNQAYANDIAMRDQALRALSAPGFGGAGGGRGGRGGAAGEVQIGNLNTYNQAAPGSKAYGKELQFEKVFQQATPPR